MVSSGSFFKSMLSVSPQRVAGSLVDDGLWLEVILPWRHCGHLPLSFLLSLTIVEVTVVRGIWWLSNAWQRASSDG